MCRKSLQIINLACFKEMTEEEERNNFLSSYISIVRIIFVILKTNGINFVQVWFVLPGMCSIV